MSLVDGSTLNPTAVAGALVADYESPRQAAVQQLGERRVASLDGIRGLAVIMVLLFHFTGVGLNNAVPRLLYDVSKFGWSGVDLFFVLSGFLITGILIQAKGSAGYFKNFYARRALRIFPAYYLLLFGVLIVGPILAGQKMGTQEGVYGPPWSYWTYVSNLYFTFRSHSEGLLGHTWSLAIEEQFYLAWPLIVLLCDAKRLLRVCTGIIIGAFVLRAGLLASGTSIDTVYFFTLTRIDELAIGAVVAMLFREPGGKQIVANLSRKLIIIAPLLLVSAYAGKFLGKHEHLFALNACEEASKFLFMSMLFAALIGLTVTAPAASALNRVFSAAPLTFFGRYSYGFYLYHLPFIMILSDQLHLGDPARGPHSLGAEMLYYAIFSIGTIGLGLLSWHLFEKRLLNLKRYFPTHG